ncbi:potassium voltage-gated channel protein egl-36-like [Saccostrea echinata]|uniref:potassium voltage-gated channel protein egl-36-like n=1 Tax=Saccostrea echinata TaxID=191078 RepID=UPI002A7F6206|nr:potassium voltage-gated channel protein egl-36-like [Saccostrea echinata]
MVSNFHISLRGTDFTTSFKSVREFMDKLVQCGRAEITSQGDYFVDRNPTVFHHVLDYAAGRKFHLPKGICAIEAREEMEFWMIPIEAIPVCCFEVLYNDNLSSYEAIEKMEKRLMHGVCPTNEEKTISGSKFQNLRETLNRSTVDPCSSLHGKIWLTFVAAVTILAIICFILNTDKDYREERESIPAIPDNATYNLVYSNPKLSMLITKKIPTWRVVLESISNVFLLLDLILRFIITHQKKTFIFVPSNFLEFIAITISFFVIYMDRNPEMIVQNSWLDKLIIVVGCLYSLRVFKLLRLAETTGEMKILKLCFQNSLRLIVLLLMIFTIFSVIFGSGMFWAEFENSETFPNMFVSIWWAVVTITTVGYGDHYPKAPFGYFMASLTAVIGLLLIAMPIASLSSSFNTYYSCYTYKKKYSDAKKKSREDISENTVDKC